MAGELALAYVTVALRYLLIGDLTRAGIVTHLNSDLQVTTLPPDRILTGESELTQLNLFLYHVSPASGLARGSDVLTSDRPWSSERQPEHRARQPLTLDLRYMLTAYGGRPYEIEVLLGAAAQFLYQRQRLSRADLQAAIKPLKESEDHRLFESLNRAEQVTAITQLTITPQFLDVDEMSKIWSALQARYRPSVCYKVSLRVDTSQL